MRRAVILVLFVLISPAAALAQPVEPDGGPRIRPTDSRLADILREGIERSATIRALVQRIEAGNVIVYLETEQTMRGQLLGSLTWIGANEALRFVRVSIRARPLSNALIACIGHELQHVVEVVDAPWVNNDRLLRSLYHGIGNRTSLHDEVWDTAQARWTTQQVMRELAAPSATVAADEAR